MAQFTRALAPAPQVPVRQAWLGLFAAPLRDLMAGLDRLLDRRGLRALASIAVGMALGWWLYVPVHELLHVAACVATGGAVTELEIAPAYGGELWARIFPFVVAGGDYAGRLSGFDTRGSDLIFLATDFGPYLLTLWPGVWALRRAARRGWPLLFGMALPVALAPLVSLTGDAYEIGSIVSTRCLGALVGLPAAQIVVARGDDLLLVVGNVAAQAAPGLWWLVAIGTLLAGLWAFGTYWLASRVAIRLGEPPAPPVVSTAG